MSIEVWHVDINENRTGFQTVESVGKTLVNMYDPFDAGVVVKDTDSGTQQPEFKS